MKNFFTKHLKNRLITLAICAVFYLALIFISNFTAFGHAYLFSWTIDNLYGFTWIIAAIFIVFNGLPAALAISAGNFAGVFLGHYIGIPLEEQAYAQITPDMSNEQIGYILETNYQFGIWILTVLGSLLLGIILTIIFAVIARLKRKPQTENS